MSRSNKASREKRQYASVKDAAQKMSMGFTATYLKLPQGSSLWKPKAGKHLIDILPYEVGTLNPRADEGTLWWEFTYNVHRAVGANNETYICPARTLKKKCPICEFREKLVKADDEDDEKLIKSLAPKTRQLINLIDLKDTEKGVQLYEVSNFLFGDKLMEDIVGAEEEEAWDLFFTLEDGKTLRVTFSEEAYGGRAFVKASRFDFKDREEPYEESILEDVHDLEKIIKVLDYDELKAKFLAAAAEDKDEDDDDDDAPKSRRKPVEEDDEEPPKRKKAKAEDNGDVDDDDDEEEVKPRGRKPAKEEDEEGEEEKPKARGKKPKADEEEDEEEKPVSKKKSSKDDDDDDWDNFRG